MRPPNRVTDTVTATVPADGEPVIETYQAEHSSVAGIGGTVLVLLCAAYPGQEPVHPKHVTTLSALWLDAGGQFTVTRVAHTH